MAKLLKYAQKIAALTLAAVVLSVPLSEVSLAKEPAPRASQKQELRQDNRDHKKVEVRRDKKEKQRREKAPNEARRNRKDHREAPPRHRHGRHHGSSSRDAAVAGLVVGAAIGAAAANSD